MLSAVEGASGGSLVTGSEVLEEEVSGDGDGTWCPGEGMVPEEETELRVAMVDGGLLRVHFSVTASTTSAGSRDGSRTAAAKQREAGRGGGGSWKGLLRCVDSFFAPPPPSLQRSLRGVGDGDGKINKFTAVREVKENNQCYLAAAEVFSRLREWVSIDSPWALACSLSPPPPPPRPPPSSPHSSASFTGWSRGVPHNGIINTQAPGAAPLSRCSDPPAAVHAGNCSL